MVTARGSGTASLDHIKRPVDSELKEFGGFFRDAMRSRVGLIDLIARYIVRQKGKRVRPILVFLSAKACGDVNESTYRAATLVEILHTATLIHDDVVDDADTRRGLASINAVWKNKVAVLMGDYLLSRGLLLSLENKDYYFLHRTSDAVKRMSEGELLQIQKSRQLNIDEETYLRIISDKTASLLSTCTEIGAASATEDTNRRQQMRDFGEHVGIAFQIRDDLLDYLGRRSIIGKPTGIDLKEKKLTLPLIYALHKGAPSDAKQALKIVKNGAKQKEIAWVVDFVKRMGGIDYAVERAMHYSDLARTDLATLPASESKEALLEFVDFVMERES
ncbi:MAG: polyprenyl synthetase family protein [Ignavibacteriales bacterium]|nr:polyprenyl synthetase family protein [Ignavibacteriales bacterium]